jgi:hypothetical protein
MSPGRRSRSTPLLTGALLLVSFVVFILLKFT